MTTFTRTWDSSYEASPPDSQAASQGATRIREVKQDIRERLAVDHSMAGDANDGAHNKATLLEQSADPTAAANTGFVYAKDVGGITELFYEDSSGNVVQISSGGALDADTLQGLAASYILDRANHTGTQTLATISDSGALAALNTVSQSEIASAAVGQGELKSTTGTVSTTTATIIVTLPGGEYGFFFRIAADGVGSTYIGSASTTISDLGSTANTSYVTVGRLGTDGLTGYGLQRYIQASPPYDHGDGKIGLYVFLLVGNGVESVYVAREAPWHYNGPTNIKADFYRDGKGYRLRRDMSGVPFMLEEAKIDPAKLAEYISAFNSAPMIEEEITQEIKNADMPLIPHPFIGNDLTGKTVVMLDPVCDLNWQLTEMCECHDQFNLNELLHEGHIVIDNQPINRAGPPGVPVVGFKWKNTRKA